MYWNNGRSPLAMTTLIIGKSKNLLVSVQMTQTDMLMKGLTMF